MSIIYALVGTTECLGIQILTIKLLLVISIVFGFFGTPCISTVCIKEVIQLQHVCVSSRALDIKFIDM
jgi:hypothetical protein